ncbi:nucleotidyltransferase [Piscibacillus sp. B03]|uniref:nucleotidyltransferase n=1 Tax=Piscibacillus sp. B03 TaxID=3457430 RepID=UPI003FCD22E9
MTQIKSIGRFLELNDDGYLINESSKKNIKPAYYNVIEEVIRTYRAHLGDHLHSIYVRGSIPRGLGLEHVSDLDTLAVTTEKTLDADLEWVERAEVKINNQFEYVNGLELSVYPIEDILEVNRFSVIPFIIKTHSICVDGKDLSVFLPDYKPDKALGNEHLINLSNQIQQAKEDLEGNEDDEDILDCCQWIMKIIVRAGLALVIEEENKYTRDLYPAYKIFSKYYPEKEADMEQAFKYAIEPIDNPNEIIDFLNGMGHWMVQEAEKWLEKYNPDKESWLKI